MVLEQIIRNSIYYASRSDKEKKILITIKDLGDYISISFLDTGFGIPSENENKIFQPFFTTKNIGEGVGLGLSVCYGIIMKHEGEIFVDKQREEGEEEYTTKITIKIPKEITE